MDTVGGHRVAYDGAGTPTHLRLGLVASPGPDNADEHFVATPQALRNVLRDPIVASILRKHRVYIRSAFEAEDTHGEGSVSVAIFRRVLSAQQIGFQTRQIEDLEKSLQFLGRLESEVSPDLPVINEVRTATNHILSC